MQEPQIIYRSAPDLGIAIRASTELPNSITDPDAAEPRLFFDGLWHVNDARRQCRPWRHGLRSMDRAECRPIALQPAHRKTALWTLAGHQLCIDQQPASGTRRA
jgi:hypothetical protein